MHDIKVLKQKLSYDKETGIFVWLSGKRKNKTAGFGYRRGYIQIDVEGKNYYAHRLAWAFVHNEWPKGVIDHKDGCSLNNKISNLRDTDQSGNLENQTKPRTNNKTSRYLGVSMKNGKWRASIKVKGKFIHLGTFDAEQKAAEEYLKSKRKHHAMCAI